MTNAEELDNLFKKITVENISSDIQIDDIQFIGSETLGEVLEKLQILNMRMWVLEDAAAEAKVRGDMDAYILYKKKADVSFKIKRPKFIQAINQMLYDSLINKNPTHTLDGDFKIYKNED